MRLFSVFLSMGRSHKILCFLTFSAILLFLIVLSRDWKNETKEIVEERSILGAILDKEELTVLTRNSPTTYYYGPDGESGYEFDLVSAYADFLGVDVRFEVRETVDDVLNALAEGEGDIAAAGLTLTENRKNDFLFGPAYFQVQQQLVCRRGGKIPGSIEEMGQVSIEVTAASSYVDRLQDLKKTVPDLKWIETGFTTEHLLERVWQGQVDCTISDSNIVSLNRRYLPELVVAFPLTETESLAWALPPSAHELKQNLKNWFDSIDGTLSEILYGRYYGHVEIFDYVDTARFKRRLHERLPHYRDVFEKAADMYGLDWKLLAAMAYQESHWDPLARSPTGVRGMMMLTLRTAAQQGVENRLDPDQSIMGGAAYFANLHERVPVIIKEPDRTWIALAAYNVGMGHVYDARRLARELGKNPNDWVEFQHALPLLAQPKYYNNLRYGYARGGEPVRYVTRVRNYYDILTNELENEKKSIEMADEENIVNEIEQELFERINVNETETVDNSQHTSPP